MTLGHSLGGFQRIGALALERAFFAISKRLWKRSRSAVVIPLEIGQLRCSDVRTKHHTAKYRNLDVFSPFLPCRLKARQR